MCGQLSLKPREETIMNGLIIYLIILAIFLPPLLIFISVTKIDNHDYDYSIELLRNNLSI